MCKVWLLLGALLVSVPSVSRNVVAHTHSHFGSGCWGWSGGPVIPYPSVFFGGYAYVSPYVFYPGYGGYIPGYYPHSPYYPNYPAYSYTPPEPPPPPSFGVIVYSATTDTPQFSWGHPTLDEATNAAERNCGADDCQRMVWVQGGCAALTTSQTLQQAGWSYAPTKRKAVKLAIQSCKKSGAADCKPRAWVCSY